MMSSLKRPVRGFPLGLGELGKGDAKRDSGPDRLDVALGDAVAPEKEKEGVR